MPRRKRFLFTLKERKKEGIKLLNNKLLNQNLNNTYGLTCHDDEHYWNVCPQCYLWLNVWKEKSTPKYQCDCIDYLINELNKE